MLKIALGLLVSATIVTPAVAAPLANPVQAREAVARLSPDDGGAVIELAAAYQQAGRTADANTALRRALTLDNVMLETPTGDAIWSHQVARAALARDTALSSN